MHLLKRHWVTVFFAVIAIISLILFDRKQSEIEALRKQVDELQNDLLNKTIQIKAYQEVFEMKKNADTLKLNIKEGMNSFFYEKTMLDKYKEEIRYLEQQLDSCRLMLFKE